MLNIKFPTAVYIWILAQESIAPMFRRTLRHLQALRQRNAVALEHGSETSGFEPMSKRDVGSSSAQCGEQYFITTQQELPTVLRFTSIPINVVVLWAGAAQFTLPVAAR